MPQRAHHELCTCDCFEQHKAAIMSSRERVAAAHNDLLSAARACGKCACGNCAQPLTHRGGKVLYKQAGHALQCVQMGICGHTWLICKTG